MTWAEDFFGAELVTKQGVKKTTEVLDGKKVVGIYFSAHWCPPCRGFTPVLGEFYEQMVEEGKQVEIVFVSSDSDAASFEQYFGSMPFTALPFSNAATKQALASRFGVRGIPTLVFLDGATGETVDKDGRTTVMGARGNTDQAWAKWTAKH